jgi:hypothetical protein
MIKHNNLWCIKLNNGKDYKCNSTKIKLFGYCVNISVISLGEKNINIRITLQKGFE